MEQIYDNQLMSKSIGITFWQRIRLLFMKKYISCDMGNESGSKTVVSKIINGKVYILKIK